MGCPAHPPADDAAGIGVDDKGDIDEASPSGHVGKVRDPQPIRCRSVELAIDLVADCRADHPVQAHLPHQPLNSAASDIEAFPLQLPPHLAQAVNTEVLFEDASDLDLESHIPLRPCRQTGRIAPPSHMVVVGRRGDRQHLADRLDPVRLAVIVDERDHGLNRRSSPAWAK